MKLLKMFKSFIAKAPHSETTEVRSIAIMQREAHRFSEEELRAAGDVGGKNFNGKQDPMLHFVSADHPAVTVLKAGPHTIRVHSVPKDMRRDEYALSQLHQPEQKNAWTEHRA